MIIKKAILLLTMLTTASSWAASVDITSSKGYKLENTKFSREISWEKGVVTTKLFTNNLTSKSLFIDTKNNEFSFELIDGIILTNKNFVVQQVILDKSDKKQCLCVKLKNKKRVLLKMGF